MNEKACEMCKGRGRGCALCRETGIQPTSADLKMGGPFIVFGVVNRLPYVVHALAAPA